MAGLMMMLSGAEAVFDEESVACTVKPEVPGEVGVPEITPVAESRVKPGGKLPPIMAHVKGGLPPEAVNVKPEGEP